MCISGQPQRRRRRRCGFEERRMDINSLSPLLSSPSLDRARVCQSLLAFTPSPNVNIYGRKRKEGRDGQSVSQARFGPLATTFTTRARRHHNPENAAYIYPSICRRRRRRRDGLGRLIPLPFRPGLLPLSLLHWDFLSRCQRRPFLPSFTRYAAHPVGERDP